jgi:hypothetical protein
MKMSDYQLRGSNLFKPQYGKFSRFRSKYASIVSSPLHEPLKDKREICVPGVSAKGVTEICALPIGISRGTSKSKRTLRLAGISMVCVMLMRGI